MSEGVYSSLNLSRYVGDDPSRVARNRALVSDLLGIPHAWATSRQVHGSETAEAKGPSTLDGCDAIVTREKGTVVAVMTADCLPVALLGTDGVAAVHVGWRGLCSGVVDSAVSKLQQIDQPGAELTAHLGPCIGVCHYEVGEEVPAAFSAAHVGAPSFSVLREGTLRFDLRSAAIWLLERHGVPIAYSDDRCTFCDDDLYSFRREGSTGRQAVIAWV